MMVLRHIGPPSATVVNPADDDDHGRDERSAIPMDLSNKHTHSVRNLGHEVPRHLKINNNNNNNVNNNNNSTNNNNSKPPLLTIFPTPVKRHVSGKEILCTSVGRPHQSPNEIRWRPEDETSYSSPDSGLHRDSPGEDEDMVNGGRSPPLGLRRQSLIPLSLIRARYNHNNPSQENDEGAGEGSVGEDDGHTSGKSSSSHPKDQVQKKRARLEDMVSHIKKTTKPERSRRHSGDDDTSSGGQGTSGDEVGEDGPTDLRSAYAARPENPSMLRGGKTTIPFTLGSDRSRIRSSDMDDEPCNLVCMNKPPSSLPLMPDASHFDPKALAMIPKNFQPLSPSDASKMYGVDPETYQQQMMQLQLTSAAMLGDPGGLLKAMGSYPPWVYLGYYSQLLHSFQAQEILRQYAIQSNTPTISQGEKSPTIARTLGSSGYNCGSPVSPASASEGPAGMDSDGSVVGQTTGGNGNGKRAPRAMTGRHVRTGTGASPTTLQTLRLKIEERQRMKAQQLRHDIMLQSHANSNKGKNSKFIKKFKK